MENFNKVVGDIISQLMKIEYSGDMSDIGNEVGTGEEVGWFADVCIPTSVPTEA